MTRRRKAPAGLLLTPGAGSGSDHHTLVAIQDAVAPLPVARIDFPYRKEGRKAPDRAPKLMASVLDDVATFSAGLGVASNRLILGGRSMGGRMCSMVVADGLAAAGLILISYPLHPPGKPENLRVEHLPRLNVPCLFVSGTRDPFGSPDELEGFTATIPGPVTHHWVEGGRHGLDGVDAEICAAITAWLAATFLPVS